MSNIKQELVETKFAIGAVVKHRFLDFRGVIFDVDPEFNNTEEWYQSIPASIRPRKNQPFYHLFAENGHIFYVAYVSSKTCLMTPQKNYQNIQKSKIYFLILKMVDLCRSQEL
jgi:heat shock protein HspQ